ncbi:nucleoside triphosphate pyrophosphohydrolase [Oceanobacillus profundus]|uniref:Phosphoribosyl-ATP pyrophosphohydrolase n=1 Tax=Oceanobacillus profundus TaxID=372463 RepID=A0A417YN11_9BACI|nr:nucleoside triphosphate pyrophosphohydrolase [Oceanobacillus profundus]MBR3119068.1 nucleoside triphosphate pyrophosphohydrolase [Oceanobacillus sp.]PAE29147.1 phosphoribosyl-ATP pyrophosphohydrolase [Paenibacillus sp. 7884-2]MCM3398246.1 nucleoside triphosphate pyrophosphohydrolase [Oceanobacillus profundus]MDO6447850.1 nucleoside triphosphate pyrophosphohydrolase [Oceanobacillus profundus]RHW35077.1 phosphoribosyl-ATP pyrophosphohydrolase [Oceanobacillus profundus]
MPTYNKLVRDRIPEILKNAGKDLKTETLNHDRYILELKKKLSEEVGEYQSASTKEEELEELADILELVHSLLGIHGASFDELEQIRADKAAKRGGFDEKTFLIEADD